MAEGVSELTEEVQNPPKFLRDFSKKESPEQRSLLAKEILQKFNTLQERFGVSHELTPEKAKTTEKIDSMLSNFYEDEKYKWEHAPYSKEDIKKYFTEENLSSLSMEDYILLLRRFPNTMVTNVVWQGIRDHPGVAGRLPGKFSNGFLEILADGKLRSPFGKFLKDGFKEEAVAQCLGITKTVHTPEGASETKEEALAALNNLITGSGGLNTETYADAMAVHVATDEVADHYYGAETGNEIFFVFPGAYIAANYYFAGKFEGGSGDHNDLWTWDEKGTGGIKLDTGILFLQADAKVNPVTGSRYELDESKRPILDRNNIDLITRFVQSDKFENFRNDSKEIAGRLNKGEDDYKFLREVLGKEFQITDPRTQSLLVKYLHLKNLDSARESQDLGGELHKDLATGTLQGIDARAEDLLMYAGLAYKEAQNPINSMEYWERFFSLHPDLKPKRVVYYHGENPTKAFLEWREENHLRKGNESADMGFPERLIDSGDPRATQGMEKFHSIGLKVIEDYFDQQK